LSKQMISLESAPSNSMTTHSKCLRSKDSHTYNIVRAYKRKERMVMKKRDPTNDKKNDRFWLAFTHPEKKDANGDPIP
jgi:hypothetical protein